MPSTKSNSSSDGTASTVQLGPDFFPACWQDDERMANLFAPFRAKSVNPVNWESKMTFWKNLIKEYCVAKGSALVSIQELRNSLQRNGHKPHCLDTVVDHLLNEGVAQRKEQFMQPPQHSWSGWAMHKLVKAPLQWGFDRVKERIVTTNGSADDGERMQFIVTEVAKVSHDDDKSAVQTYSNCWFFHFFRSAVARRKTVDHFQFNTRLPGRHIS